MLVKTTEMTSVGAKLIGLPRAGKPKVSKPPDAVALLLVAMAVPFFLSTALIFGLPGMLPLLTE